MAVKVSSAKAKGLDSGRRSHRVEPLWRPISVKLEFRLVPASPERLQPLLLIGLFWCPARWLRRPESIPLADPSVDGWGVGWGREGNGEEEGAAAECGKGGVYVMDTERYNIWCNNEELSLI